MEWIKVLHILCVMGWMTGIFAVPRMLIYWKREWAKLGEFGPLGDVTVRIYRFSNLLSLIAVVSGLWLAWQWGFPTWSLVKFALVLALGAHYGATGAMVKRAKSGEFRESDLFLRIFNEASVLVAIGVLILVVFKPF